MRLTIADLKSRIAAMNGRLERVASDKRIGLVQSNGVTRIVELDNNGDQRYTFFCGTKNEIGVYLNAMIAGMDLDHR